MLTFVIPWPPPALSPNARNHWAKLARAKKKYREECSWKARAQGVRRIAAERLDVSFTFFPPTKHRHDVDNCIARAKSGIDGIADAIGVDDSCWRMIFEVAEQAPGGKIEVTIR